jgi:hypothetical protein
MKNKKQDDVQNGKTNSYRNSKERLPTKTLFSYVSFALFLISLLAFFNFNHKETKRQKVTQRQKKKVEQSEKYKEQVFGQHESRNRTPMHMPFQMAQDP